MIGFYQAEDIESGTLFTSIKDALSRMEMPLCGSQHYDGASNVVGYETGARDCVTCPFDILL